jgi:lipoate synthase
MNADQARKLKEAGLDRLNHNLNTSENHYSKICTTHTYADRLKTIKAAKEKRFDLEDIYEEIRNRFDLIMSARGNTRSGARRILEDEGYSSQQIERALRE